jgi:hypothetical protein
MQWKILFPAFILLTLALIVIFWLPKVNFSPPVMADLSGDKSLSEPVMPTAPAPTTMGKIKEWLELFGKASPVATFGLAVWSRRKDKKGSKKKRGKYAG